MLGHPFPRVRRIAAENLYVRLLENPSFDEKHPALNLLLSNPWDGDESQDRVQKMVEEVVDALGIDPVSAPP